MNMETISAQTFLYEHLNFQRESEHEEHEHTRSPERGRYHALRENSFHYCASPCSATRQGRKPTTASTQGSAHPSSKVLLVLELPVIIGGGTGGRWRDMKSVVEACAPNQPLPYANSMLNVC